MSSERLRWICTRLSQLFRRKKQEASLDAEMNFHLENLAAEFRAEGMTESDARLAAQKEFGSADVYREETRDVWRPFLIADLWRSVCFAVRSLMRTPGFTAIALLTIALGVGANTSMFSISNTVMLKPLPYPESASLDQIFRTTAQNQKGAVSASDYRDLQSATADLGELTAYAYGDISLSDGVLGAESAESLRVEANFFSTLGILPSLGRSFLPAENIRGNHRVIILSERFWLNRFGGDKTIIGQTVRIDGEPHEVVGVLPSVFNDWRHLGWVDVFRPLALSASEWRDRDAPSLIPLIRRKPGIAPMEAHQIIAALGERLAKQFPSVHAASGLRLVSIDDVRLGETGGIALIMLIGLSGFVLLIACSNLANFYLARAIGRSREFAVRGALGASRGQLLRPILLEALILALAGGALAVLVAVGFSEWVRTRSAGDNGEFVNLTLDWKVMVWALSASVFTALLFSLAPAFFALRMDLFGTLKSGGRGAVGSPGHRRLGQILIVGQFALALILLTGAALFVRGLNDLNNRRQGWESDQLLTVSIKLPEARYGSSPKISAFERNIRQRLSAIPGVTSVSSSTTLPFFSSHDIRKITIEGMETPEPGREPAAYLNRVSSGYFTTVGTQLFSGREFTAEDGETSSSTFIINEAMARGLFGKTNPIGQRISLVSGNNPQTGTIVGVVRDVKSIFPDPVGTSYQLYRPFIQEPGTSFELALRTAGSAPSTLMEGVRLAVRELDADLPLKNLKPADLRIARANYQLAVLRDMLSAIAFLGLALAALGLYGVIARTMALRSSEFGVRLALGAQISDIMKLVLSTGVKLALFGAALGLFGAYGIALLLGSAFPGMPLESSTAISGSAATLITVALLACYLPARNASRISPCEALRAE